MIRETQWAVAAGGGERLGEELPDGLRTWRQAEAPSQGVERRRQERLPRAGGRCRQVAEGQQGVIRVFVRQTPVQLGQGRERVDGADAIGLGQAGHVAGQGF